VTQGQVITGPRGVSRKTFGTNTTSSSIYLKGGIYRNPNATGITIRYVDDVRLYE
jgi:hypothetical protein